MIGKIRRCIGLISRKRWSFAVSCLLEAAFIISFLYAFWTIVYEKIFQILLSLQPLISFAPDINADIGEQAQAVQAIASDLEFLSLYEDLLIWIFVLAAVLFLAIILFHGVSNYLAARIVKGKVGFFSYMGKFISCSFIFYLLTIASFYVAFRLALFSSGFFSILGHGIINGILIFLLLIILYFWSIAAVMASQKGFGKLLKETLKKGIKNPLRALGAWATVIFILGAAALCIYGARLIHPMLLFGSVILILPIALAFARVLFFSALDG